MRLCYKLRPLCGLNVQRLSMGTYSLIEVTHATVRVRKSRRFDPVCLLIPDQQLNKRPWPSKGCNWVHHSHLFPTSRLPLEEVYPVGPTDDLQNVYPDRSRFKSSFW